MSTGRRPHWTDDLIDAVGTAIENADSACYPTVGMVSDVIAVVEDWLGPVEDMLRDANAAQAAEKKIQAVREACDEALHEDPMPFGDLRRGYNMAMKVVLNLLNGERDE